MGVFHLERLEKNNLFKNRSSIRIFQKSKCIKDLFSTKFKISKKFSLDLDFFLLLVLLLLLLLSFLLFVIFYSSQNHCTTFLRHAYILNTFIIFESVGKAGKMLSSIYIFPSIISGYKTDKIFIYSRKLFESFLFHT